MSGRAAERAHAAALSRVEAQGRLLGGAAAHDAFARFGRKAGQVPHLHFEHGGEQRGRQRRMVKVRKRAQRHMEQRAVLRVRHHDLVQQLEPERAVHQPFIVASQFEEVVGDAALGNGIPVAHMQKLIFAAGKHLGGVHQRRFGTAAAARHGVHAAEFGREQRDHAVVVAPFASSQNQRVGRQVPVHCSV